MSLDYKSGNSYKLMMDNSDYMLDGFSYEEQTLSDKLDDFYLWFISNLQEDAKTVCSIGSEALKKEYKETIRKIESRQYEDTITNYISLLNSDSALRMTKILSNIKNEYKIINSYEKDLVFFNDLLGWYKKIPNQIEVFIKKLFSRQNPFIIQVDKDEFYDIRPVPISKNSSPKDFYAA